MTAFSEWLLSILKEGMQFFIDLFLNIAGWLWEALLELMSTGVIVGVIQTGDQIFTQIPSSVWFFMNACQVPMGIVSILTAYTLRFFIRRIPFIG